MDYKVHHLTWEEMMLKSLAADADGILVLEWADYAPHFADLESRELVEKLA